jgi:hypothetical protein
MEHWKEFRDMSPGYISTVTLVRIVKSTEKANEFLLVDDRSIATPGYTPIFAIHFTYHGGAERTVLVNDDFSRFAWALKTNNVYKTMDLGNKLNNWDKGTIKDAVAHHYA